MATKDDIVNRGIEVLEKLLGMQETAKAACDELEELIKELSASGSDDLTEELAQDWAKTLEDLRERVGA